MGYKVLEKLNSSTDISSLRDIFSPVIPLD